MRWLRQPTHGVGERRVGESVGNGPGTTYCPDCEAIVSVRAPTCPQCGAPLNAPAGMYEDPERPGQMRYWNGSGWAPSAKNAKPIDRLAIVALVLAIAYFPLVSTVLLFAVPSLRAPVALVYWSATAFLGVRALRRISSGGSRGRGLAVAAIVITLILLAGWLVGTLAGVRTPIA